MAVTSTLRFHRGNTVLIKFKGTAPGSIAGTNVVLTLRPTQASSDPPALSKAGSVLIAGSSTEVGWYQVPLTRAETLALTARNYVFGLNRIDAGFEKTLADGKCSVLPNVQDALA